MLIEKVTRYRFDLDKARQSVLAILAEYETNGGQLCLTHRPEISNPTERLYDGTGSLYDYTDSKFIKRESEFTVFNDVFKDTYLYTMYKSYPDIGRMRIMVMDGPRCYTIHRDVTKRTHLVLYTDPNCYFVFPELNEIVHLPADGMLYSVDTTEQHTFVNGSKERRIHIVMDDLTTCKI